MCRNMEYRLLENKDAFSFFRLTCKTLKENEGNWYPPNLNPYIGREAVNSDCTIFAVDSEKEEIAGWITGLDVNGGRNILYRTLFVRPEYRDTRIGFYLFRESVRQNVTKYPKVTGIASVEKDNKPMLRFLASFLQGAYDYKSYEYRIEWDLQGACREPRKAQREENAGDGLH